MSKKCWVLPAIVLFLLSCNDRTATKNGEADSVQSQADSAARLELVFSDSVYQLTGVAALGGQVYVNYPRWSETYRYGVVRTEGQTGKQPYPDELMNQWKAGQPGKDKWVCVQSVYFDDSSNLWVLDPSAPKLKNIQGVGAKLVRMGKTSNKPEQVISFMKVVPDSAYVNDVRIDNFRQFAYLTESKGGGILIADLATNTVRRVLAGHPSTKSDPAFKFVIDGKELMKDGKPAKFNSDGIALTPNGEWLYYKPLTDDKLYRVRTAFLRDKKLVDTALANRVEDLGHFVTTDGMIFDKSGNLYLGDLQRSRIVKITPDHKMSTVVEDERLLWPDSYAIADGYLYISCSQIHKQPEYNAGVNKRTSPYTVYRIKI